MIKVKHNLSTMTRFNCIWIFRHWQIFEEISVYSQMALDSNLWNWIWNVYSHSGSKGNVQAEIEGVTQSESPAWLYNHAIVWRILGKFVISLSGCRIGTKFKVFRVFSTRCILERITALLNSHSYASSIRRTWQGSIWGPKSARSRTLRSI